MPDFNVSKADRLLIFKIADRALKLFAVRRGTTKLDLVMSLTANHKQEPLDLKGLFEADDGPLGHDVFGIHRYVSHATGKLTGTFVPRYRATPIAESAAVKSDQAKDTGAY